MLRLAYGKLQKHPRKIIQEKYSFWFTISELSGLHGRKDIVEKSISHHGGQETEREYFTSLLFMFSFSIHLDLSL